MSYTEHTVEITDIGPPLSNKKHLHVKQKTLLWSGHFQGFCSVSFDLQLNVFREKRCKIALQDVLRTVLPHNVLFSIVQYKFCFKYTRSVHFFAAFLVHSWYATCNWVGNQKRQKQKSLSEKLILTKFCVFHRRIGLFSSQSNALKKATPREGYMLFIILHRYSLYVLLQMLRKWPLQSQGVY